MLALIAVSAGKCNSSLPPPSPQFNVVYRDKFVIAGLQHCQGEGGSHSNDVIRFVSKIACQCIVMQSDPGVPRTFVTDCSS